MIRFTMILLTVLSLPVFSQGSRVTITLTDGTKLTGELIYVRPNGLLLYPGKLFRNAELEKFTRCIQFIPQSQMAEIQIPGRSYVLRGILIGIMIPAGLVYLTSKDNEEFFSYGVAVAGIFSSIGAVIGGFAGKRSSVKEQRITLNILTSLDNLKTHSRLQGVEPDYLKAIK